MNYNPTIYEPIKTNPQLRYALGTKGTNPLFIIGLNPSTADDKVPDRTILKVNGYATRNNNDSFIMLNLYAQRTQDPNKLHLTLDNQLHNENVALIRTMIEKYKNPSILAAWGNTINKREYLKLCLADIFNLTKNKNINWLKIGDLTKSGHPRHPSRASKDNLTNFDLNTYLTRI